MPLHVYVRYIVYTNMPATLARVCFDDIDIAIERDRIGANGGNFVALLRRRFGAAPVDI
jgi:hypothetical protein